MGVTWAHETAEEFGVGMAEVGRAYWAARQVLGPSGVGGRSRISAATVSADAEEVLDLSVANAVQRLARRYLLDGDGNVAADRAIAQRLASDALCPEAVKRRPRPWSTLGLPAPRRRLSPA